MRTICDFRLLAAIIVFCVAASATLGANQSLPKAETILDRYIEVTGGKAGYERLRTQVSSGTVELSSQGITGTITTYRAFPNQAYIIMELPLGKIEEGVDGETAWQKGPMMRPRIKDGQERANALRAAAFNGELRWRDQFSVVELVGVEKVGNRECYKILMSSKDLDAQTRYFDKDTNLLVKLNAVIRSPVGEVATETIFGDYREEGGIVTAHKWIQNVMGQQITTTLKKVEYNAELPPGRFDPPAEIKALIGAKPE